MGTGTLARPGTPPTVSGHFRLGALSHVLGHRHPSQNTRAAPARTAAAWAARAEVARAAALRALGRWRHGSGEPGSCASGGSDSGGSGARALGRLEVAAVEEATTEETTAETGSGWLRQRRSRLQWGRAAARAAQTARAAWDSGGRPAALQTARSGDSATMTKRRRIGLTQL